jgi:hypothetical protein
MATINLTTTSSLHPNTSFVTKKHNSNNLIKFNYASSLTKTCAQSQGTEAGVSEDDSSLGMHVNNSLPFFLIEFKYWLSINSHINRLFFFLDYVNSYLILFSFVVASTWLITSHKEKNIS